MMRTMRIPGLCLSVLLLLGGCAAQRNEELAARLSAFVNRSEAELIRELGVPTRTAEADGATFLAYSRTRRVIYGSGWGGWGGPWGGGPWGWGGGWAGPADVVDFTCEATFEVRAQRVVNVQVRGNGC